jgi:hypothetical protein
MRYVLMAVPEGETEGQPDPKGTWTVLTVLPEGTYTLDVQACWSVTEDDGKFRGGAGGFHCELEHTRS